MAAWTLRPYKPKSQLQSPSLGIALMVGQRALAQSFSSSGFRIAVKPT